MKVIPSLWIFQSVCVLFWWRRSGEKRGNFFFQLQPLQEALLTVGSVEMKLPVNTAAACHSHASDTPYTGFVSSNVDSFVLDEEESSVIPPHPLGLKPSGNQYTAVFNARQNIGGFQALPDEILMLLLESFDSYELILLGSTCKQMYAFCRADDLWKTLFIE